MLTAEDLLMVGASDAAAIVGLSPYRAPIDVWRRCMGEQLPEGNAKALRRGQLMEPVIREMAREEYALTLLGPRRVADPKRPHLRLSLDDVALGREGEEPVELKSVSPHAWRDYADGQHPVWHECQVQLYLHGLRAPRAKLFALIGSDDLIARDIEADLDLQTMLLDAIDRFWRDHVLTKVPPPPDSSESYREWLVARYQESQGTMLQADDEIVLWAERLRAARELREKFEAQEREARNWLTARIGEADGIQGEDWRITYRSTKGRPTTDWQAVCMEAEVPPSIVERHISRKPFRTFRFTTTGGK